MNNNKFLDIITKVNKFDDVTPLLQGLGSTAIGRFFEILTRYVFLFDPRYSSTTEAIWLYSDVPTHLQEQLKIPKKDKGIDLVLLMTDQRYCAIQCKFRTDPNSKVTWDELSKFAGQMQVSGKFYKGYYVTNTYNIDAEIKKADTIVSIYGDFFNDLPSEFFQNIVRRYNKQPLIVKPFMPRPHQVELIAKCTEHFKTASRGTVVMACGTGKTLGAYWVDKKMNNKLTVIAVPSITLLSQFFCDWVKQSSNDGSDVSYILVGSDVDTDKKAIPSNGLIVTTNENEIFLELYLKGIDKKRKVVIITTYQSAHRTAFAMSFMTPDLIIFDEAHKTVGDVDKHFNFLMFNTNVKATKRLFMTATPKIYNKTLDDDSDVISMDNLKLYGKTVYDYSTRRAIRDGYLSDYRIVTMMTNDAYIEDFIRRNKIVRIDDLKTSSHYVVCAIMILKSIGERMNHHVLTYHNTIQSSKYFADLMTSIMKEVKMENKIKIINIDGSMNMTTRNKLFKEFADSKLSIMTSSKVLNEGVNIPIVDAVCFVDRRTSSIDIQQCIGRSMRLHDRKQMANILVPFKCSDINDLDDSDVHGNLVSILKAMADSDESIKTYFQLIQTDRKNSSLIVHKSYFAKPDASKLKSAATIDLDKWIDTLETIVWKLVDGWQSKHDELIRWMKANKRIPNTCTTDPVEKNLAVWCTYQRVKHKANRLEQSKVNKLNMIPGWHWSANLDDVWQEKCEKVSNWVETNDKFPQGCSKYKPERCLALWCERQKLLHSRGKLRQDRKEKLESIPGWFWTVDTENTWKELLSELLTWIKKNKRFPKQGAKDPLEKRLGKWCARQKQRYRIGKLPDNKKKLLEAIPGWNWIDTTKIVISKSWDERFDDLVKWITLNKRLPSKRSKDSEERSLGVWCFNRRMNYKNGKLTQERIEKLESIDCWKWTFDEPTSLAETTWVTVEDIDNDLDSSSHDEEELHGESL